jgi:hypothetical protein
MGTSDAAPGGALGLLFAFRLGTNTEKAKVTTPLSTMLETSFTALGIYCLERVREGRRTPPN